MDKPHFENLFWNDKFKEEVNALYEKAEKLFLSEGKRYPFLQNNNFIERDSANPPQSLSCWLNEKEDKRFVTYKREKKKEGAFNKTPDDTTPF